MDPSRAGGHAAAKPHVLSGLVYCGKCRASYQLETSGKKVDGNVYRYCYYNCRNACRAGSEVCSGFRIPTDVLAAAVLEMVADAVCTMERAATLARSLRRQGGTAELDLAQLATSWRTLVMGDHAVSRSYAMHLVKRIDVHGSEIIVTPKTPGAEENQPQGPGMLGFEREMLPVGESNARA